MFIDYLTLMLINMAAGYAILACYVFRGLGSDHERAYAPAFAITGLVAFLTGLHMTWTWPLPGAYNSAFGETSVMLGVLFLGAALAVATGWGLHALGVYAVFAGIAAIVLGVRIMDLGMTRSPRLSGIGFILSGAGGVLVLPVLALRKCRITRTAAAIVLLLAAIIWARAGYMAYWGHMAGFKDYKPPTMQQAPRGK